MASRYIFGLGDLFFVGWFVVSQKHSLGASLTDRPHKKKLTDRQKNFKLNTCEKRYLF